MSQLSQHSAGGPMAGYLFQCRLALLLGLQLLKKKPNGHISIEKFDDIDFDDEDFSKCLVQAKHSFNPSSLTDNSVDLWKSLKVWMDQLNDGAVAYSETRFILITTSVAAPDSAAANLRPGSSRDDVQSAHQALKAAAEASDNAVTKAARNAFLALSAQQALTLLSSIEVIDQHPNLADVMSEIEGELRIVAPENTNFAATALEGWWLSQVGRCLIEEASASIPVQQLSAKASEIGRNLGPQSLFLESRSSLDAPEYSETDEAHTFVRQMRIVQMPDSIVRRSVQDFYQAYAQRSKWAREKLLLDDEIAKFDDTLVDGWERKFDEEKLLSASSSPSDKIAVGQKVCLWATKQSQPLRNVVETWITAGSYQSLADRLRVGWHPDYVELLGGRENDEDT